MIWNIKFFPATGKRLSPYDYIANLPDKKELGRILHQLRILQELEFIDWPPKWTKHIENKLNQLRVGDYRLMFCLDRKSIVILHAFRKRRQQTNPKHIRRAQKHYDDYISQKGVGNVRS